MLNNKMTELLHIKYPVLQAPMAGGVTTSTLVAEVSNAGGLGSIGAGYLTPVQMQKQIREVKKLTANYFGINLFVPNKFTFTENEIHIAHKTLQPIREKLGLQQSENSEIPTATDYYDVFKEQIRVIIEEKVPVCSFTFGIPSQDVIDVLKEQNIILIGTATTVREAIEIEKQGFDLIVVQGSEAGGHRGHFMNGFQESLIGLMSLIPQVVDQVSIPVIAAGGIMDGRGLMAAICLGAKGVQMGTAFLTCIESGAPETHKEAILNADEDQTVLTRTFSGKWARGIKNRFIEEMQEHETSLPEFPVQNILTQTIRKTSTLQYNQDFMSLWSGQSPRLAKTQTVAQLMKDIIAGANSLGVKHE